MGDSLITKEIDSKLLILFVLNNLSGPIGTEILSDLCTGGEGIGYFDYSDALAYLVDRGLVCYDGFGYSITDKGKNNVEILASTLPYTLKSNALDQLRPVEQEIRRNAMIKTGHITNTGGCTVKLVLSDGAGEYLNLSFLCSGEEEAESYEKKFRDNAEKIYGKIVNLFNESFEE